MNDHKEETHLNAWHLRQVIAAMERTANQGAAVEAIGKALAVLLTWREGDPELQPNYDQEHRVLCSGYTVAGLHTAVETLGRDIATQQETIRELIFAEQRRREAEQRSGTDTR